MSNQEIAFEIYKNSRVSDKVQNDLNSGCNPDDNYFLQGVFDEVYSLLSDHFSTSELDEIEIGTILDDYHYN